MIEKEKATARLSLRIAPSFRDQLAEVAAKERRSINNLIVTVMEDYIKEQEISKKKGGSQ